jgi:perosamine synthetase
LIPVNRPLIDASDVESVMLALSNTYISGTTPLVSGMEAALSNAVGTSETIAVSTGTAAIDLTVEALDIKSGDHCIVPSFTIISTVSNLLRKGANLEFIDADQLTWSMDAEAAAAAVKSSTKLVLPVHIYGLPVDMDPILLATRNSEAFILEDAAEALGVKYKGNPCGSLGDAAIFSFYANKIITGGEGGAITTNHSRLASNLRSIRNLAYSKERYVSETLGWNARISGLSAALIFSQLKRLNTLVLKKQELANLYLQGLENHPWLTFMPTEVSYAKNTYWVFPVLLNSESPFNAKEMQLNLHKLGIESRRFFCPMNLQPVIYNNLSIKNGQFPVSNNLWERGLYLPSGLGNTAEEIELVISALWDLTRAPI